MKFYDHKKIEPKWPHEKLSAVRNEGTGFSRGKQKEYDPSHIEPKWQKLWEKQKLNSADDKSKKPKFYSLIEFPYPSGDGLHVGHIRSNMAMDVISRKRRAEGFEVLYPMGWDAFGLPTENYAIKTGIHPEKVTKTNTTNFRKQLKRLGFSFDWSREINTSDPAYYKWTQWVFLKFFEHGLAYKKKMAINWCSKDKIGLANEEVVDGKCERCGTAVEKREKEQWMLAITKYADRLDRDLDAKKILIGTRNPAKVKMIKACLAGVPGIELLSLDDIPAVDDSTLLEGDNFKENAKLKSEFYFKKTGIPTISTDHILWIEKWPENNGFMVHMRKHANPKSERATDEEVIVFLKNFLKGVGGSSKANFHYAISYTDESGTIGVDEVPHHYILQTEQSESYWPGYPTEALLKDAQTGVFKSKQTDEVRYSKIMRVLREKFAPRMLKGAGGVNYLEKIKIQQKNWIGRSEGVNFKCKIKDLGIEVEMYNSVPQTYYAETFTVIAPEHPLVSELVKDTSYEKPVMEFVEKMRLARSNSLSDLEKNPEGIFTGRYVENFADTGKDLPIWIASYVVADYGTGIVNASAHDERDFTFAKAHNIPLHPVMFPENQEEAKKVRNLEYCYARDNNAIIEEPTRIKGRKWGEVREDVIDHIVKEGFGERKVNYKLRDWVFSRQRYWGEPIPLVFCEGCKTQVENSKAQIPNSKQTDSKIHNSEQFSQGELLNPGWFAVPEKDLPIKLPKVKNYKPTDTGESPLASIESFVNVKCPHCGRKARRETDTMPNWAGSSWYYLRYIDPKNKKVFVDNKKLSYWSGLPPLEPRAYGLEPGPVDWYNGGMEHTTLHLLYSRFWHKFLFDLGLVPTSEPYAKRTSHGLILAEGGVKMSKSKGNVVNPDSLIETFGADTLRLYEMFMGPFDQHIAWSTDSMVGPRRFLEKVWRIFEKTQIPNHKHQKPNKLEILNPNSNLKAKTYNLEAILHQTIKKVSEDIEAMRFNTAVSALMIFSSELEKAEEVSKEQYEILLCLLAPFTPHICEELWNNLGNKKSITLESWPIYDEALIVSAVKTIVIQVNGKVRANTEISSEISQEEAEKIAKSIPEVQKWIEGKPIKKIIYIKNRLINIVV